MPLLSSVKEYENYMGISPKPKDFDKFWEKGLKELEETEYGYYLKRKPYLSKDVLVHDFYFTSVGGAEIHGLFMTKDTPKKKGAAVVAFHGYTSNVGSVYSYLPYVYNDISVLAMDIRGQGGLSTDPENPKGSTVYGQIIKGVEDEDLNKLFFRNVYLDAVKAVRLLMTFDFVDENRIGVTGKSQGGALSLVCAALENRIKATCVLYPFLTDFKQVFASDLCEGAYSEFKDYFRKRDPMHRTEEEFFNKLSYIDVQNFAPRVKAQVLWFMALSDKLCHPKTQFAAYNKINSEKELILYPEYTHEPLLYSDDMIFEYFRENL